MTTGSAQNGRDEVSNSSRNIVIAGVVALVSFAIVVIVVAILLAANPQTTAPSVLVIRDLLIILLALTMIVIASSIAVLLIQVARLVNLLSNEIKPIIDTTADTVNTVRGTAQFVSKHVTEPVISTAGALGGIAKIVGDVELIRKAAGMVMQAAMSGAITGAHSTGSPAPEPQREESPPEASPPAAPSSTMIQNKAESDQQPLIRDDF